MRHTNTHLYQVLLDPIEAVATRQICPLDPWWVWQDYVRRCHTFTGGLRRRARAELPF